MESRIKNARAIPFLFIEAQRDRGGNDLVGRSAFGDLGQLTRVGGAAPLGRLKKFWSMSFGAKNIDRCTPGYRAADGIQLYGRHDFFSRKNGLIFIIQDE